MFHQSHRGISRIPTFMRFVALLPLTLVALTACTPHDRSPDEIREQTARATSTAARDAKAAAQGVVQGLKQERTININHASADDLKGLPGIVDAAAQRIIDHRPYTDSEDLVKRRVISRAEYDRIAGKIEAR
jgi:DNA uptake protein ComE-like DNA-binding protein